ncbi:hypothetical protein FRC20_010261 [Serendipita sp. 405]|nr:hypothetical protein FRC20_010261 [Serendipita sp. 405]
MKNSGIGSCTTTPIHSYVTNSRPQPRVGKQATVLHLLSKMPLPFDSHSHSASVSQWSASASDSQLSLAPTRTGPLLINVHFQRRASRRRRPSSHLPSLPTDRSCTRTLTHPLPLGSRA